MTSKLLTALVPTLLLAACAPSKSPSASADATLPPVAAPPSPSAAPSAVAPADSPPVENGLYAAKGACPFEGCQLRQWRVTKTVDLRDAPNASAKVVATASSGEWVQALESVAFLVPERGVVVSESGALKPGDVIYLLDSQGEGSFNVWRHGELTSWTDDGSGDDADPHISAGVKWDTPPIDWHAKRKADEARGAGWWAKVARASGEAGWARVGDSFTCTDQLGGDDECEAHQRK
jgi:hypothetical protein